MKEEPTADDDLEGEATACKLVDGTGGGGPEYL